MSPKLFLSSSFSKKDKKVINKFKTILDDLNIEYYFAEDISNMPKDIIDKINQHELFMAILTKKESDQVPQAVTFEIGAAITLNKKVIVFKEESIPLQTMYSNKMQKKFNRNALLKDDKDEIKKIKKTIKELIKIFGYEIGDLDTALKNRFDFARSESQLLGSTILGYFNDILYRNDIRDKAVKNFPTEADRKANRMIITAIEKETSTKEDGIISEESIDDIDYINRIIEEKEFVWIIDPLDGTLNFAYGFPFFCVSLGLLRKQEPVLGVLYNPTSQELYCGINGRPSECFDLKSGTKRVIKLNSEKSKLEDCIIMTHLSSKREPRARTLSTLDSMADKCRSIRMLGSGQMALAALAINQFDVFFNFQTNIWDIVPGYVIIKGAGGYVTTSIFKDPRWNWRSKGIIAASNKIVGKKFTSFIRKNLKCDFPQY